MKQGLKAEAVFTLRYSEARYLHVLAQLDEKDLWWRPYEAANAAGNIVLHACGNMRQWLIAGLGGGQDTRDREGEFAARSGHDAASLSRLLQETVNEAVSVIEGMEKDDWLETRHVQNWPVTGLGAMMHGVAHFEGHAQEVIYIARLRLGEAYRFKDVY
ncbi:DUF1572 family protein [Mucisphaera calidilacus]|nr:DUF1572 family protein [Mucisphaera calidilacus]